MQPKVFCIGFHKTGTSSMGEVLRSLGYNWYNYRQNPAMVKEIVAGNYTLAKQVSAQYEAFEDDCWPFLFKELDKWYPGSKFILTVRDQQQWMESVTRYFTNTDSVWRSFLYGHSVPAGHEQEYLEVYNKHNADVLDYFKDRPQQLLVLDITAEPDWKSICAFLERPVPLQLPFPHLNPSKK